MKNSSLNETRTRDSHIKSVILYQLSYKGITECFSTPLSHSIRVATVPRPRIELGIEA